MSAAINPLNYPLRLEGDIPDQLFVLAARAEAGINALSRVQFELVCSDREVDLTLLLGRKMRVVQSRRDGIRQVFPGTCVSVEFLGTPSGPAHYAVELRPWLWFLTRAANCRVFQDITVPDIVKEVLGDHGFGGDLIDRLNQSYEPREYVIQYRESDLDFLNRLLEEEGIYYFLTVEDDAEKLVLADGVGSHEQIAQGNPVDYLPMDSGGHRAADHIFDWRTGLRATTGKITLNDYNFETPRADLETQNTIPKGSHPGKDHEAYGYPGHFRANSLGETRARVRMEAEAARHHVVQGAGNAPVLAVGETFTLKGHRRASENADWMVIRAVHVMCLTSADRPPLGAGQAMGAALFGDVNGDDPYRVLFQAVPKDEQYRAPLTTPWPEIAGVHTAVVTGPAGEEIHTDKYGRVRVQFHWDRKGAGDDTSSCWVRCMMPWTGKAWGMIAIPRIGQEVVVQFEEGDPDRPLVIGMLYNADTMPPYDLPANMTQSGVKTNSSKGGGGFNELMMEDKKGAELVRFQAQRDFKQIVKNNAEITVGLETKKDGILDLTVHKDYNIVVKTGDYNINVEKMDHITKVKRHQKETVDGNQTVKVGGERKDTVTGDVAHEVTRGNFAHEIKEGNADYTVYMGNLSTTVGMGDISTLAPAGKIEIEAMQSIELKVGGSSIKIDQMGVTIKGAIMVEMSASLKATVKAVKTEVSGSAMLTARGGVTMIN